MAYFPAPTKPTRLLLPDGSALSGDVSLLPGNFQQISKQGNGALLSAGGAARARGVELFIPGVLAARTALILPVVSPVLSSVDAFFKTAPAATDVGNFARLRVKGLNPGSASVALPFQTNGVAEYHLGYADLSVNIGSFGGANQGGPVGRKGYGMSFHPSANVTVGGIAFPAMDSGGFASLPAGAYPVRVGLADSTITGTSGHTVSTVPWIKDLAGNVAYVDVPAGDLRASVASSFPWSFAIFPSPVALTSGTTYRVMMIGGPSNTYALGNGGAPLAASSGFAGTGNVVPDNAFVLGTQFAGGGTPNDVFGEVHALDNPVPFLLLGSVIGTALSGVVSIGVEINGAPATPGADLALSCQL